MGYIILGIIILLLLTVFMTDLYRSYRDTDDQSYTYRGQAYHSEFGEDINVNDDLDDIIDDDYDPGFIWNNAGMNNTLFPNQMGSNLTEFSDDIDFDVLDDDNDLDEEELTDEDNTERQEKTNEKYRR